MPERCVVAGCSNITNIENGVSLHRLPFFNDERPEAKRRRRKWIESVNRKHAMWLPSKSFVVSSVHFMPEDFANRFVALPELNKGLHRKLIEDDIGFVLAHFVHVKDVSKLDMTSFQAVTHSQVPNERLPPPLIIFLILSNPLDIIRTPRLSILRKFIFLQTPHFNSCLC